MPNETRQAFCAFAHIGDLHLTEADADNAKDFEAIIRQLNQTGGLDFVFLPGDNADNGAPAQYALVRREIDRLHQPVHVISGDHDMEGGSLDAFYAGLETRRLPYAVTQGGIRCLFLDMCGPGTGGPDFRLGEEQLVWLSGEIVEAAAQGQNCALFMHSYPADLKGDGEASRVASMVHRGPVRLVEMGHTHYNELANDGRTVYAATRSTGQIEEGPVGYAVAALDNGRVSWRFKELARPWPFVLITAPSDRRLAHDAAHVIQDEFALHALVLGSAAIAACEYRINGSPWRPMTCLGEAHRYAAHVAWPKDARQLTVRVTDSGGVQDEETIEPATRLATPPAFKGAGSDADAIGAWPEKSVLGTQLGPNRNGKKW